MNKGKVNIILRLQHTFCFVVSVNNLKVVFFDTASKVS